MDFPVKKQLKPAKVLNTKISHLLNCSESNASKIKKIFTITKVKDLIPWVESKSLDQLNDAAEVIGISQIILEEWIVLAKLAKELPEINASDEFKIKLVFAGLDRAGKTSLINFYVENQNSEDAIKTKPTRGATITTKNNQNSAISIWELGGQMSYREEYIKHPEQLPPQNQEWVEKEGRHRSVCDYLAGMTDRFAQDEYRKLFHPFEKV